VLANQEPWQQIGADAAGAGVMPEDVVVLANPISRRLDEAGPGFARALLDEAKNGAQRGLTAADVKVNLEISVEGSKVEEAETNLGEATLTEIQEAIDAQGLAGAAPARVCSALRLGARRGGAGLSYTFPRRASRRGRKKALISAQVRPSWQSSYRQEESWRPTNPRRRRLRGYTHADIYISLRCCLHRSPTPQPTELAAGRLECLKPFVGTSAAASRNYFLNEVPLRWSPS